MNYNEALTRYALLQDVSQLKITNAKTMTALILLRLHYGKAQKEWIEVSQTIQKDEAEEDVKTSALKQKAEEKIELADKRISVEDFTGVVEAAMKMPHMTSLLFTPTDSDTDGGHCHPEIWLSLFAQNLVES